MAWATSKLSCLALEFSNLHKKVPTINEGKHNMMTGILGKISMLALSRNLIAENRNPTWPSLPSSPGIRARVRPNSQLHATKQNLWQTRDIINTWQNPKETKQMATENVRTSGCSSFKTDYILCNRAHEPIKKKAPTFDPDASARSQLY